MAYPIQENSKEIKTIRNFKKTFILEFTKQLIKHSVAGEIFQVKNIIKEEIEETKKEIKAEKKIIKQILKKEENILTKRKPILQTITPRLPIQSRPRVLTIPEVKLPAHLSYLKPIATMDVEIDLEKLNPLIKDPSVNTIEVNPDEKVIVTGRMGKKSTSITLNKEEINKIIQKFSELSKIPINEGVFRVAVGRLILSAIISEVVGSKFIIKKISPLRQPSSIENLNSREKLQKQIMPPAPRIPEPRKHFFPKI